MTLEERLKKYQEKIKQNPLTSVIITIALLLLLLIVVPYLDVSHRGINNATVEATLENQSRATLAQILGGAAIGIGLYYTWRRIAIAEEDLKATQKNLEVAQEGQITERFTRAVDQLGNPAMEIRLGGIYALERIANESEKDYWPIVEILTAYIRKNSSLEAVEKMNFKDKSTISEVSKVRKVSLDIQAILSVIGGRKIPSGYVEPERLNLQETYLQKADLIKANLQWVNLTGAHLEETKFVVAHLYEARLEGAYLEGANLSGAYLAGADLKGAHLKEAVLVKADLKKANLMEAHLEEANLCVANLEEADLKKANLKGVDLRGANLKGAKNLTFEQLSKAKTLYIAQLDPELEAELRAKGFGHLIDDEPEDKQ